jgi:hypothetical protein
MPASAEPDSAPPSAPPWGQREPAAGEEPPPAYAAGLSGPARLLARAAEDRQLAAELLRMAPLARIAAATHEPRFHRYSLVQLLAIETEAALDASGRQAGAAGDPRPLAELGAALAAALPRDGQGKARRAAAWAWWLLGKAWLAASQPRLAEKAFQGIYAYLPRGEASEEEALSAVGLAQVWEDCGNLEAAAAQYLLAAYRYARLDATLPAAACQAQLGFLRYDGGDLEGAAGPLRAGLELLDPAFAPSLAARMWLVLAEIETMFHADLAAAESLHRARRLYPLAPSPGERVERIWREARIALAAGADAEARLDVVRRQLLAHGSLAEAARSTFELLLLRLDDLRFEAAGELAAALAAAFPPAAAGLAAEMASLVGLAAADQPLAYHQAHQNLTRRLRHQAPASPGRRPLLRPTRWLADRLLCRRAELEDPIGAAAGL